MSIAQIIGAAFGFVIIAVVLWNLRGGSRGGSTGEGWDNQYGAGPGSSGFDGGGD